eukprot:scaffold590_cov383-Prasinococcus_capsulatus_cf.AAC.1
MPAARATTRTDTLFTTTIGRPVAGRPRHIGPTRVHCHGLLQDRMGSTCPARSQPAAARLVGARALPQNPG